MQAFNMEVLSNENQNLTKAQKELLLDHQRLGHINMQTIQRLYQDREVVCEFDGCENRRGACLTPRHPMSYTTSSRMRIMSYSEVLCMSGSQDATSSNRRNSQEARP
jgi:hypothetical protein